MDENCIGDNICYISDLAKMNRHYPRGDITKSLDDIFGEIAASWRERTQARHNAKL